MHRLYCLHCAPTLYKVSKSTDCNHERMRNQVVYSSLDSRHARAEPETFPSVVSPLRHHPEQCIFAVFPPALFSWQLPTSRHCLNNLKCQHSIHLLRVTLVVSWILTLHDPGARRCVIYIHKIQSESVVDWQSSQIASSFSGTNYSNLTRSHFVGLHHDTLSHCCTTTPHNSTRIKLSFFTWLCHNHHFFHCF